MKKKLLLLPVILVMAYFVFSSHSTTPSTTGINGTAATGFGNTCQNGSGCHTFGFRTNVTITLDSAGTPVGHYIAGQTYHVRITGVNTSTTATLPKFGLQVTAVKATGAGTTGATMAGSFPTTSLPPNTAVNTLGGLQICEHTTPLAATTGSGGTGTTYVDSFEWTAPSAGTGSIRLYGTINAVNNDAASSGDAFNLASANITELTVPATAAITGTTTVCVGSTTTLSDATAGGTWSSATPSVATISSSGVVTGVSGGTSVISYAASGGTVTTTVTVNPMPSAGTITGSSSLCVGSNTTLTTTGSGGSWTSGSTAVATVTSGGVVHGVTAGTTIITYTSTNSCGTASAFFNVNVSATVTGGTISGPSTACTGSVTALTESIPGGTWTSTAPSVATVDASGNVTGVTVGTVTISYAATTGCGTGYTTHAMTVAASPTAGAITGIPSLFCTSGVAALTASVSGGVWSVSNSALASIDASGMITGLAGGTDTIYYAVTNAAGCTAVASATLLVHAGPPATITTTGGVTAFCAGSSLVLHANTGSGLSWQWYNGATPISGATSSTYTATAGGSYIVDVTNGIGCTTASAATVPTVVTVPEITVPAATTVCAGGHVALSVPAGSYTTLYQWKKNTVNISGATTNTYTATGTGSYTCFQTISGGCAGITSAVNVTVQSTIVPPIAYSGTTFSTGTHYANYQWQLNGTAISGATSSSLTTFTFGTYTVRVTDTFGCTGISAGYILSDLAVGNTTGNQLQVYPNPANNVIVISNAAGTSITGQYFITDVPGKTVLQGTMNSAAQQVDISTLAPGNYILKVISENGMSKNELFIKQ